MAELLIEPPYTKFLHRKAGMRRVPLDGTFELTPTCNMNCKMCYVRMSKAEQEEVGPLKSAEEWLSLAKDCVENGMVYLLLTGGEPFLRNDLEQILTGLHELGLIISINTNGTLIDEETVRWLKKCPPSKINITLYGSSNETYRRLCNNPNGFSQVTKAIDLLRENGFNVKLNCTVTPYNYEDLDSMINFAKERNLIIQATPYLYPALRKSENNVGFNDRFSPEKTAYLTSKINLLQNGLDKFKQNYEFKKQQLEEKRKQIAAANESFKEGLPMQCNAAKSCFWVNWKGDLLFCGMIPMNSINVFDQPFSNAWGSLVKTADQIRLPVACRSCEYLEDCRPCAANVYCETGSYSTKPEYKCRLMKSQKMADQKILEEMENDCYG